MLPRDTVKNITVLLRGTRWVTGGRVPVEAKFSPAAHAVPGDPARAARSLGSPGRAPLRVSQGHNSWDVPILIGNPYLIHRWVNASEMVFVLFLHCRKMN